MVSLSIRDLFSRRYTNNNRWCSKEAVPARLLNLTRSLELACLADSKSSRERYEQQFASPTAFGAAYAKRSDALDYAGAFRLVDRRTPFALTAQGRLSVDGNRRPSSHWVVA
ncbi:hypothetical protein IQ238_14935 [Pleurocapsales cyanobacterium LEGE 06147]|nr:hypothetical protein [Pleurocapsales cyanobacterium LEGE 06147]